MAITVQTLQHYDQVLMFSFHVDHFLFVCLGYLHFFGKPLGKGQLLSVFMNAHLTPVTFLHTD